MKDTEKLFEPTAQGFCFRYENKLIGAGMSGENVDYDALALVRREMWAELEKVIRNLYLQGRKDAVEYIEKERYESLRPDEALFAEAISLEFNKPKTP